MGHLLVSSSSLEYSLQVLHSRGPSEYGDRIARSSSQYEAAGTNSGVREEDKKEELVLQFRGTQVLGVKTKR